MQVSFQTKVPIHVIDVVTKYTMSSRKMKPFVWVCNEALKNNNVLDVEALVTKGYPRANIQELMRRGEKLHLWNTRGKLLQDGLQACEDGLIHVPENGKIRLWVFEHPIAGLIPIHATDNNETPVSGDVNNRDSGPILKRIHDNGRFQTLLQTKSIKPKWFDFIANYQKKNWNSYDELRTEATLSWNWKLHQGEFILDRHFSLEGEIKGLEGRFNHEENTFSWNTQNFGPFSFPYPNQSINPEQKFREWLSTGEYAGSSWDIENSGMRRPYSELTSDEKLRQTIGYISLSEDDIEEWDTIEIRDIPLIASTENDATEWAGFLLEKRNPGYWTTERTERLLADIVGEKLFCTVEPDRIITKVNQDLAKIRIGSRISKLFNAGDDMSSVFVIEDHVLKQMKEANKAQYIVEDGYSKFLNRISDGIKGETREVWYVDRYTVSSNARKELSNFTTALREHFPSVSVNLLTSHELYRPSEIEDVDACVALFRSKLTEICDNVRFMEENGFDCPHHRYIVIKTNKETRWWVMDDGLLSALDRPKHAGLWDESSVEKSLVQHLEAHQNKEEFQ